MNTNDATSLETMLSQLKKLDHNGWATLTDGTLDNYSINEQIEIVWQALCEAKKN